MKKREKREPFAENLLRARKAAGFKTSKEFAAALNITQQGLSQYENGTHEPGLQTLCRIATLCNTSTDELLGHPTRARDDVERLHDVFDGLLKISYAGPGDDATLTREQWKKVKGAGIVYVEPFHADLSASESELQERAVEMLALPVIDFLSMVRGMMREFVAPALLAYIRGVAKARMEEREREQAKEPKAKKATKKRA